MVSLYHFLFLVVESIVLQVEFILIFGSFFLVSLIKSFFNFYFSFTSLFVIQCSDS